MNGVHVNFFGIKLCIAAIHKNIWVGELVYYGLSYKFVLSNTKINMHDTIVCCMMPLAASELWGMAASSS